MKYYILYNGENRGPLELEELEEFGLNPKSRVWAPGWANWQDAGEVPEILDYFSRRESEARKRREEEEERKRQEQELAEIAARQTLSEGQGSVSEDSTDTKTEEMLPADIEWYIDVNGQETGPVKESELTGLGLTPDTLVWHDKLTNWTPAREVAALSGLLATLAKPNGQTVHHVTRQEPQQPVAYTDVASGNTYTTAILAVVASVAVIATVFAKAEFYDTDEKLILLAYCAAAPFLLTVGSLIFAKKAAEPNHIPGEGHNSARQAGVSMGLGIGAILASAAGLLVALKDFCLA